LTAEERRKGNGCLYALLGLGVLLVGASIALEVMPELPSLPLDRPPPPPPAPYAPPEPLAPAPAPAPAPPAPPEPEAPDETLSILWHASFTDAGHETACVLRLEVTPSLRRPVPRRLHLECADGTRFEAPVLGSSLSGIQTDNGPQYELVAPSVRGRDIDGAEVTTHVNTHEHSIRIEGSRQLPPNLYVEELSAPSGAASLGLSHTRIVLPLVRIAVPTTVSGAIPSALGAVRGTGREPRPGDPVCELLGWSTVDSGYNCRITLRCAGELIYGAGQSGFNACELSGGAIERADDTGPTSDNTDPVFDLDVSAGTLLVSDDTPADWSARFDLIADPRCEAREGVFVGSITRDDGQATESFTLDPFAAEPSLTEGEQPAPLGGVVMSCAQRRVAFTTADGETGQGWLSTGARSIVGTIGDRSFWAWAR